MKKLNKIVVLFILILNQNSFGQNTGIDSTSWEIIFKLSEINRKVDTTPDSLLLDIDPMRWTKQESKDTFQLKRVWFRRRYYYWEDNERKQFYGNNVYLTCWFHTGNHFKKIYFRDDHRPTKPTFKKIWKFDKNGNLISYKEWKVNNKGNLRRIKNAKSKTSDLEKLNYSEIKALATKN